MKLLHWQLFLSSLLLFSVLFKGVGGYSDLYWYLEDSVHLWTRGSMEMTPAEAAGSGGRKYHRFAPGLAIVSGPFVIVGALLHRVDQRISIEFVATLLIPLMAATAVLLLFKILMRLGAIPADALWSVAIFAFGSPFLSFTRLYYAEIVIIVFLYSAIWFWLKAQDCEAQKAESRAHVFCGLSGLALTGVMACHYVCFMSVAGLLIAWALAELSKKEPLKQKVTSLCFLSIPILVGGSLLLLQNFLRYGNAFTTGYNLEYGATAIFSVHAIPGNVVELLRLLVRTPWAAPAMAALFYLHRTHRVLVRSILLACVLQQGVWLSFVEFSRFSTRYDLPSLALVAIGLPMIASGLKRNFSIRGIAYAGAIFILFNLLLVLRGDDWSPPFQIEDAGVSALLWYRRERYVGFFEWSTLLLLLASGVTVFWRAAKNAQQLSETGSLDETEINNQQAKKANT